MKKFLLWSVRYRKMLAADLNTYIDKLISDKPVTSDDAAKAHCIKLELNKHSEKRFRSIQTLVEIDYEGAIAPLLSELVSTCSAWPAQDSARYTRRLAKLVQRLKL